MSLQIFPALVQYCLPQLCSILMYLNSFVWLCRQIINFIYAILYWLHTWTHIFNYFKSVYSLQCIQCCLNALAWNALTKIFPNVCGPVASTYNAHVEYSISAAICFRYMLITETQANRPIAKNVIFGYRVLLKSQSIQIHFTKNCTSKQYFLLHTETKKIKKGKSCTSHRLWTFSNMNSIV